MFKLITLALLIVVSASFPARAAENPMDFTGLLDRLRQHPEIQAYAHRTESLHNTAEGELGLPDPMLFVQERDYPLGSSLSRDQEQKMIGFKQAVPALGTRRAKSARAGAESFRNAILGDFAFSTMTARLITALANLQRITEQEKLLDEQAALFESERISLKGRITAGQAPQAQLLLSEADRTDLRLMRADLGAEKHEIMALLVSLVGDVPQVPPPPVERVAWNGEAEKTYPVVLAAQDIEMARQDVALREAEFNPNFEVEASYGRMNGGDSSGTVMVGMSLPLWAAHSQRPRLSGAQSGLNAAHADLEALQRQTVQTLMSLQAQIDASTDRIETLKHKISLLKTSSSAQAREYEAGKADLSLPLRTRRDRVSVRIQLAAEQARRIALIADFNHYFLQGDLN